MKHKKRLLSLLLTISMAISLIPATVMADTGSTAIENKPAVVSALAKKNPTETPDSTFTTIESAGKYLADRMALREETVELTYMFPDGFTTDDLADYVSNQLFEEIYDQACAYDRNSPNEGDYLKYHMIDMDASISYTDIYATYSYRISYRSTAEQEALVGPAIESVLSSLNLSGKSEYEIFSAIYDYIVKNVFYDHEHLGNNEYQPQYTAYAAIIQKTAVCQGYANLLYRMLLTAGIECRIVSGDAATLDEHGNTVLIEGTNYIKTERHAWNIVKLDNKWYNVDATWDSSGCVSIAGSGASARYYPKDWCLKSEADFPYHYADANDFGPGTAFASDHRIAQTSYIPVHPSFIGHQVRIKDNISVSYWVYVPANIDLSDVTLSFAISNGRPIDALNGQDGLDYGDRVYFFDCDLNALEIADSITATLHYTYGGETKEVTNTYSVLQYCNTIKAHEPVFGEKAVSVVNSIIDYGYYLQQSGWTDKNHHAAIQYVTAPSDMSARAVQLKTDENLANHKFVRPTDPDVEDIMFSLVLQSYTAIKIYVKFRDGSGKSFGEQKVTIDNQEYDVGILVSHIGPTLLGNTFGALGGNPSSEMGSISALSYIYAVVNNDAMSSEKKNAMAALYNYYLAVKDFAKSV